MWSNNLLIKQLPLLLVAAAFLTQYAGAAGLGWVLNGRVINGVTCAPIVGANVSSPYNNYAYNLTNTNGNYSLVLGTGNWSITVTAAGLQGGSYLTPYYSSGAFNHNFALLPLGGKVGNCPGFTNTTVINSTATTITPGVNTALSTVPPTTNSTYSGLNSGITSAEGAALVIIVIVIIAVVAYLGMKGSGKKKEHHQEGS